jgi:tyrosinase
MNIVSRRKFLGTATAAAAALAARPLFAQTGTFKVRRNVNDLLDTDSLIVAYKKAVEVMRSRPATDVTSWVAQATIHQNFCPHGNWFFLPWHRAYLQWFEDICREASGYDAFALPYWDWTNDPQIPHHFWGNNNPLTHDRDITPAGVVPAEFVGTVVMDTDVLATPDFQIFASGRSTTQRGPGGTGRLEGTPHNNVHVEVGGDMLTFMSPLDPIFWLHHANVDRLWTVWLGKGNANTNAPEWLNFVFTNNFVNRRKQPQSPKPSSLLSTYDLGYRYDTQPEQPVVANLAAPLVVANNAAIMANNDQPALPKTPFAFAMKPNNALNDAITRMTEAIAKPAPRPREAVRLTLKEIEIPKDLRVRVRVFINCDYLTVDTPLNSPSYVGSISFFGLDHVHDHGDEKAGRAQPEFIFDITKTLARLKRSGALKKDGDITVQLLALPGTGTGTPLQVKRFAIEAVAAAN